jgi:hypothetical protein
MLMLLEAVDTRIPVIILGDINVSYTSFLTTTDVCFSSPWHQMKIHKNINIFHRILTLILWIICLIDWMYYIVPNVDPYHDNCLMVI